MSFTPHPVIPQTPEQARQRDHLAGLDTGMPENPEHELARLRQAVREHRDAVRGGLPEGVEPIDTDLTLWAHLPS